VRSLQKTEFFLRHTLRLLSGSYGCIVACDTVSLLVARTVNLVRGTPYLYHSRELVLSWDLSSPGARAAKWVERRCHRRALFTVIQDRTRAALLGRDNGVPAESFLIVPNAPLGDWPGAASRYLHDRLGIPGDAAIVLHAGGVTPETMVLEIVESLAAWPPGPVLVVHGAAETTYLPVLQAAAARFPGRVFFSTLLVPPEEVDPLFASAAVGLAFYRPVDDNCRYVGHAAGKIFNLMKVGIPVVSNDLPGLRELLDGNGCGRVVTDPGCIGSVLREILADPGPWRASSRETFPRFEFSRNYAEVIRRVEAAR
jgi:glycosyltransferase involved in cell wall biosynthesis